MVIDNSSAFRMEKDIPLIVPEINEDDIDNHKGIIANPNCSTAITLMGLYPLHKRFGLKRFFASTYQAVSGAGSQGFDTLERELRVSLGESIDSQSSQKSPFPRSTPQSDPTH